MFRLGIGLGNFCIEQVENVCKVHLNGSAVVPVNTLLGKLISYGPRGFLKRKQIPSTFVEGQEVHSWILTRSLSERIREAHKMRMYH